LGSVLSLLPRFDGLIFTCNNSYKDVRTDVWLACDPAWHAHYGQVTGDFDRWHWSREICDSYGYRYVEGVWHKGLWLKDKSKISLNHCSGAQLLNLAANQYECSEIVLVGHDFKYVPGQPRHYFDNLSETPGEYPAAIRKHSKFDKGGTGYDLLAVYKEISETPDCPPIFNATEGSALPWFPFRDLKDFLRV
jgi:hypothetical protein